MSKTYIYIDKEFKMTGRTAVKQGPRMPTRGGQRQPSEVPTLYEITPVGDAEGTFTLWVSLSELYLIEDNNAENKKIS